MQTRMKINGQIVIAFLFFISCSPESDRKVCFIKENDFKINKIEFSVFDSLNNMIMLKVN